MCEPCGKGFEESFIARPLTRPGQPTAQERLEHEIFHLPPRIWRKHCVEGRRLHDQHRAIGEEPSEEVPIFSADYCFMGLITIGASDNPVLIMHDNTTSATGAYLTRGKGAIEWVVKAVCKDLEVWGYGGCRIAIKSDQEPAIKSLKATLARARSAPTAII